MGDEPSYMAFARSNVRHNVDTTPVIVRKLLETIDTQARRIELLEEKEDD